MPFLKIELRHGDSLYVYSQRKRRGLGSRPGERAGTDGSLPDSGDHLGSLEMSWPGIYIEKNLNHQNRVSIMITADVRIKRF